MKPHIYFLFAFSTLAASAASRPEASVRVSEGALTIPTYEHSGRETQPPLFGNSTVTGLYPFPTYILPFKSETPEPKTYRAVFLENEYLKLTYLPELGGRFFSLYDKLRAKEVFYRNDVIKPTPFNPRLDWPQSGIELTGPHDVHMLTLRGEPFWSHVVVSHPDGSISLVLGEYDPIYHMEVNFTATLHPGIEALEIGVFCYNRTDGRMPQMFWTNASLLATEKTRFLYPMTRTIGHTTAEVSDWPVYNGVDYSWDRNNKHMLGVFGIDIYDNFAGAYQFDRDYGVFRFADRRQVQGMKMWTWGYGEGSRNIEQSYTDQAGPYVEVQSGRHVWDGHYEWVEPHKAESWSEWWIPVSGLRGLTTMTRDIALNLTAQDSTLNLVLEATRALPGAKLIVASGGAELLRTSLDLEPGRPVTKSIRTNAAELTVLVTDAAGRALMNYRSGGNPGRKEYTPFTRPLENPPKRPDQMSAEELTMAAEYQYKELNAAAAADLLQQAFIRDPGYSRAHLLLAIHAFNAGRFPEAAAQAKKAVERDPYLDEGWYYLAMAQLALGDDAGAERNLYYIWPASAYFGVREYQLGRLALLRKDFDQANRHLERAVTANGWDLNARVVLAMARRDQGDKAAATKQLAEILAVDPADRQALAERFFLTGDATTKWELLRLMGGQSQEAIDVSMLYRNLHRWREAAAILQMVEENNHDPWGTAPEYFYALSYCLRQAGDRAAADSYLQKARTARDNIDRFPYRAESEAPLAEAVKLDPHDATARFYLACLLYYRQRPAEAIEHWKAAVGADPSDFRSRRALGLAYAEQGQVELGLAQLERAVELNPAHIRTLNDLSALYARTGKFDAQLALLNKALECSPGDDDLATGLLTANLIRGDYQAAEKLIETHRFAPRHRTYNLRDQYRYLRYGMGSVAFRKGAYEEALRLFQSALKPPVSLGVDDFQFQSAPRVEFYIGRTLEALGWKADAAAAYQTSVRGVESLSGDRDSWNSENFYMVLSLEKMGRAAEAASLLKHFEDFALTEIDDKSAQHRSEARYLLALVKKHAGETEEARKLMSDALAAEPDLLGPRYELRGDVPDAFAEVQN